VKRSQTFTRATIDALEKVKNHAASTAPPPRPKLDAETARKLAAAPTRVALLTGNVVQSKAAARVTEQLRDNPTFRVTGETMGATSSALTRVIYWSEYDKPRADALAELLRGAGLPQASAQPGGDPNSDPGSVQINFGRDAEQ
jgi:hypothetical protein